MPLYQVDVDGQTVEFDSPVDLTPEQLEAEVSGFRSQIAPPAAPEEAPGYLSQLGTSLYQSGRQALGGARTAFNALTGDTADMAAGLQQQAEAQRALQEAQTPEDVAFLEDLNKQAEELKQARGFLPTLSEAIDLPMAALRRPGAAIKTAVQSLPNALISTPITLGAGLVGTAAGGLVGLPTAGPGAVATGIAGGIAAGTAANTALEAGSEIYQRFVERIGDPAGMTREQIAAALDQNPDIASEGLTTGLTRGAVIGTIETLGLKGAGALLAAPERAAIQATRQVLTRSGVDLADDVAVRAAMATPEMAKATKAAADAARAGFNVPARAVGAGAVEIGASGVGEALAQQAAGQETDYADVFLEMLGGGVASAPFVLAARGIELAGTGIQAVRERVSEQVADNAKADARLDIDDLINNAGENAATQINQAVDDAAKVVPAGQPADRAAQIKARLAEIEAQFGPPDQTTFDAQGNPVITPYRVMTTEESRLRQEIADLGAVAPALAPAPAPAAAQQQAPAPVQSEAVTVTASGKRVGDKVDPGENLSTPIEEDLSSPNMPVEYTVVEVSRIIDPAKNEVEVRRRDMTPAEIAEAQQKIRQRNEVAAEMGLAQSPIPEAPASVSEPTPIAPTTSPQTPATNENQATPQTDATRFPPSPEGGGYPQSRDGSRAVVTTPSSAIIEELSKLPSVEAKLDWLHENGFLTQIEGVNSANHDGRVMVLMRIGSVNVPFYISTGMAGKKNVAAGKWYAVWGIGKSGWINKGREEDINTQYGFPVLQKLAKILNEGIGTIDPDSVKELGSFAGVNPKMNMGFTPAARHTDSETFWRNVKQALTRINEETEKLGKSPAPAPAPTQRPLPAPQAEVVSPEGVTPPQPLPPTGGVPTESLPAGPPTSGDVGTALRAVATNTATPEQVASLEAQGLARTVQGQPVITDAGLALMPEAERPRLTEAERVAEIEGQAVQPPAPTNTPPANVAPSVRPLQGDQQRNETSARRRRGKAQVPASLRDRDGPPLPNIKVSANDGARAREIEDKQVPGAKDTWIGTAAEYLAEFPDQTAVNDRRVEAFYDPATDRAVILIDRVVARDGDAIRAARNGTSAAVEAVRRLIRHESFVHRGWRALPQNLKTEFLAIAESLVPEEEINAIVAKGYSRYANWSTDPAVRALVVEEWLAQRLETLEKLPATDGGPLSRLIDWAKRVWQWLNGNDAVEPTRAELVDVMRQMIRALEIGEKESAARGAVMASLTDTDATYMDAVYRKIMAKYDGWKSTDVLAPKPGEKNPRPYSPIVKDLLIRKDSGEDIPESVIARAIDEHFQSKKVDPNNLNLASQEKVLETINSRQREEHEKTIQMGTPEPGTTITVRQDVPSHKKGVGVTTTQIFKNKTKVGTLYFPSVRYTDPVFGTTIPKEKFARSIAKQESDKGPLIHIDGKWSGDQSVPADLENWTQVGFNPDRHSYYYEKGTNKQVFSGDEAFQVGNTVFVKNPNFEPPAGFQPSEFRFSLTDTDAAYMDALQGDNGNDNLTEQIRAASKADRQKVLNDWIARNLQSAAELQRMVNEAARAIGYDAEVFHGTDAKNQIGIPKINFREDSWKQLGIHVGSREAASNRENIRAQELAREGRPKQGAWKIMPLFLKGRFLRLSENRTGRWGVDDVFRAIIEDSALGKQMFTQDQLYRYFDDELLLSDVDSSFDFDSYGIEADTLWHDATDEQRATALIAFFQKNGYDGIEYDNEFEGGGTSYLVLSPSAIKSADPITLDDAGNVIPLSQRFQPESPDIRFSLTDPTASNIIQDANQTTNEQQPTRSRPLSPDTAPGRATEVLPTGEEIVERTQIDKTSMPRLEALAIKFVDSLGPVDTWPNKILNTAWWRANGGNMRDDFGQMVMAEALYRTGIGALQGNPTLVEVNDLISREYQTGATEAAKALASRSYVTTSERYGPMFAVQGMIDQRRRQQETVIDANVDVAAGVDAVNNADAQAQSDASAELDEELRLKDAIYELGLAARTPEIQTRIRRINDNVFRLGVLAQIREQLLSRVQASFVGLSRAAVEQQYASLSVEQIDAEIARLEREVADDVAAVESERQRVRAAPKPKGAAADPITQARTIIARLEADPKTKKTPKANPVRDLYREHLKNPMAEDEFMTRMAGIGVPAAEAQKLYDLAAVKIAATEAVKAQREAEGEVKKLSDAERFAERVINDAAERFADPALPIEENERKALPIRDLFNFHVQNGMTLEAFIPAAAQAGLDEATARRLHGAGLLVRDARQSIKAARTEARLDEVAANEAGRIIYETSKLHRQSGYINTASPAADTIRKAFTDQVKEPKPFEQFVERLKALRIEEDLATRLFNVADREHTARKAMALERKRQRAAKEDSPAVAFAKRTIDDVASRLADPALPQEERQRKVLAIRELYKEHVRDGLPFDVFISRAEAAGVEGAMASTLHGVGLMEREARETTRGYNEAQAGQRFAEKTINDAATLYADPALPQPVRNKRRVAAQELYNKHVKKAMAQAEFLEAARKAGVNEATAMVLFNVGNMTREAREAQAYGRRLIERRERLLDAEGSALENLINNLRGKITGDLSWREMFDRPLETQRQWRRDLFAALRNDPALAGLTPQEIGDLVVEIDKVWEAKRKKNFEAQLKRMNLPGAKGNSKDKIVKSAPKLLRYINAGFFNDAAFRNAISEEFGIPALNEETVKQVVDLMQRAQADGITEVERKGLMIEAIRLMQRDLKAELGDILSNYWVTSVLSGFATQFDMAFSALNGMRVMAQSMADLAIRKREFKLAGRAGMAYLRALGNVILEAARYFYTGDPKLLDNYQYTLNTYLTEGSAAANPFDYFERVIKDPNRPSWAKIMPYFYAGMQRAMTAFDHINSTATTQGMLEMAMFYNRELYEGARMPSKEDVAAARAKAVEMVGGDKTWGQKREVSSYTRQILNELLNKKYPGLLDEARDIGKVVSYTNDPTGIGGIVYHTLLGVTNKYINEAGEYRDKVRAQQEAASRTKRFMANLNYLTAANARNMTGLRFVRFVGNRLNEILSFTPGLGLLRLQEKGMTPTMRAMIIQNQTLGLSLSVLAGVTILRALTDEEDDEKRGFRISGSWSSLPPDKKNQLRASDRTPYSIEMWNGKRWIGFNYNAWPIASIIATVGNLNDQRLFNPEKWEEKDFEDKLLSAAWAGAFSFKDLSALSGFMDMIGKSAYSTDPVEGATQWLAKFSTNYVGGFVPRMLKDIDLIMDPETRKARDFGAYFAKELPFFRRTEAAGEKLYNIFGEPVKLNRMPWRRAVTATREEPEYETLAELNRRGIFLGAANPSNRTVGSGATRRELTDAEAEKYMVETGKLYRDFIKQQGQSLLQLDRAQAEEVISKTTERLRAAALRMSIGATK